MKLRIEGLDLLHQPIDEFLRVAHRQRRDIINGLIRIKLGTLSARMRQRVHDVGTKTQEPELERLEKTAGACADDDDVRRNCRGSTGG
jgi:hypothetical protein